jgi:hypothetical protein
MLTFLVHKLTKLPLASTPKHMTMVLCPLLEPIVGFLFSHILMGIFVKVRMDMVSSVLNIVPLKSTTQCNALQKDIGHESWKVKIIS